MFLAVKSCNPICKAPEHRDQLRFQYVALSRTLLRQMLGHGDDHLENVSLWLQIPM